MRPLIAALAASLLLATPALAKSHTQIVPPSSAMHKVLSTPAAQIPALCAKIVADQNKSKVAMTDAGMLLFHGELMGQHCVQVDYVRAITLVQQAGDTADYNAFIRILRVRAGSGNPLAVSALQKLHLSP